MPQLNTYIIERWTMLSDFVYKTCEGRDSSHGHSHMEKVASTSHIIAQNDYATDQDYLSILMDAITIGWLHDVCDHKYDHDGTLERQLDEFGFANIANFEHIKKAIKLISYSSENTAILAGTPIDYEAVLGSHYTIARHIASDADKLEAIGLIGITRCNQYTRHSDPTATDQQIVIAVIAHAREKLLRLKDQFIRTPTGKLLAIPLHHEMINCLNTMMPDFF